jgi:hypothetical protein
MEWLRMETTGEQLDIIRRAGHDSRDWGMCSSLGSLDSRDWGSNRPKTPGAVQSRESRESREQFFEREQGEDT